MVKVGKFNYELSTRKDKKLMTVVNGKVIHFGQVGYEHYKDKTNLLDKSLSHGDKERKKKYLLRAKGIKDKEGNLTYKDIESPNWHAVRLLWS